MLSKRIKNVEDVRDWRMCIGCGACVSLCDNKAVSLQMIEDVGVRPFIDSGLCESCGCCLDVCPGYSINQDMWPEGMIKELNISWGPVLEVWEGYACDPEIRFLGSSGGIVTAISQYCLEHEKCGGCLQVQGNPEIPWENISVYCKDREQLIGGTGSRYAPASVCAAFDSIEQTSKPSVFAGKPCDVAAMRKYQKLKPSFSSKVHCAISLFCAGTPSLRGTFELFDILGVDQQQISKIRYRGQGWPGDFRISFKNKSEDKRLTYREAWDKFLTPCVQWGCRMCPDHTGESADISCGDPWYHKIKSGEIGRSLILIRTEKGRRIFQQAMKHGYIHANRCDSKIIALSQISLLSNRRQLYGRLLAMRLLRVPYPTYKGFHLKENFFQLKFLEKLRSILGTMRRVLQRGYRKPLSFK